MNSIESDTALLTLWPPALGLIVRERAQDSLSGTTPHVSTLCLPDVTARDQIPLAFSLHICILQILEVGTAWERG